MAADDRPLQPARSDWRLWRAAASRCRPHRACPRSLGAGRLSIGPSVCMSTAAYSAAIPVLSATFGIGALVEQHGGEVVVRVDDREHQRRGAVGIAAGSRSAFCVGQQPRRRRSAPSRAAYISGVQPPRGSDGDRPCPTVSNLNSGKRELLRSGVHVGAELDQRLDRRRRGSRPPPTSARVWPCHCFGGVDVGAAGRASACTASALPVRAAVISTVSPSGSGGVGIGAGLRAAASIIAGVAVGAPPATAA